MNEKSNVVVDDGLRCERLKSATITRKTIIYELEHFSRCLSLPLLPRSDLPSFKCVAVIFFIAIAWPCLAHEIAETVIYLFAFLNIFNFVRTM